MWGAGAWVPRGGMWESERPCLPACRFRAHSLERALLRMGNSLSLSLFFFRRPLKLCWSGVPRVHNGTKGPPHRPRGCGRSAGRFSVGISVAPGRRAKRRSQLTRPSQPSWPVLVMGKPPKGALPGPPPLDRELNVELSLQSSTGGRRQPPTPSLRPPPPGAARQDRSRAPGGGRFFLPAFAHAGAVPPRQGHLGSFFAEVSVVSCSSRGRLPSADRLQQLNVPSAW